MNIQGWTLYSVLLSSIIFVIFCFVTDYVGGGSNKFSYILCRLVARHIKLAFWLVVGEILVWLTALSFLSRLGNKSKQKGGGPQSEKLAGFLNAVTFPVQCLVYGVLNLLGLVAVAILFGQEQILDSYHLHPVPYTVAAAILYLLWLGYTIRDLVKSEITSRGLMPQIEALHSSYSDVREGFDAEQRDALWKSCCNLVESRDADYLKRRRAIWSGITFAVWASMVSSAYFALPVFLSWLATGYTSS